MKPKQNPVVLASQIGKAGKRKIEAAADAQGRSQEDAFLQNVTIKKQRDELESLKVNEKEAREQVLLL